MAKKILIIDDEADVLKTVFYRLKAKGYEVFTALNGQEGIDVAKKQKPDLIILDFRLPDMSALEVNTQVQKNAEPQKVPVILITASVERISDKAKDCGAGDYIAKPIEPDELYAKVAKSLGSGTV